MPKEFYCMCGDTDLEEKYRHMEKLYRAYLRIIKGGKTTWVITPYWICPKCYLIHQDPNSEEDLRFEVPLGHKRNILWGKI